MLWFTSSGSCSHSATTCEANLLPKGRGRGRGKGGKNASALAHIQQSLDRIATGLAPPAPAPAPSSPADAMRQLSDDLSHDAIDSGCFHFRYVRSKQNPANSLTAAEDEERFYRSVAAFSGTDVRAST